MIGIVTLVLNLLSTLLESAKQGGVPAEVLTDVRAAFDSLTKVVNTPTTYQQLEGLRATPKW